MISLCFLVAVVFATVASQGNFPGYFYPPQNVGGGYGPVGVYPYGYGFNQYGFPPFQYPQFYGGSYNGVPFGGGATVTTAQSTPTAPGILPVRESTVVETVSPNQGVAVLGGGPTISQNVFPQSLYQPAIAQQPSVVQSNTLVEVDNPVPPVTPGHYEFYQYGRDGFDSDELFEGRVLPSVIRTAPKPPRAIQPPFTVNKRPHFEFYSFARSEPTLFTP